MDVQMLRDADEMQPVLPKSFCCRYIKVTNYYMKLQGCQ